MTGVKGNAESSYRTGNVNLTQANIIGSSAIGSTTRPIYYTGSAFSGTTATVGSTTRPIYMNGGVLSGTTATVGGTTRPVYLNAGVISGTTATVGAANKPIYMSGGVLTATASTIGGASQIMYMSGGVLTAGTTLGSFATKNSLNWGEITQSGANNIDEGSSDFTDNTEIFSSYASNNGFADSNGSGKVYRRDAVKMYNYISGKLALGTAAKVASGTFSLSGHTHSYLPLSGGTMTGSIKWTSTSLPEQTGTPQYLVVIDAFASGGTQKWKSASSVSVGSATTASKLGSSNVGTNTKFIYLESGTPKASTANVGGVTTPIYISGGVLTAGTALGTAAYKAIEYFAGSGHTHNISLTSGGTSTITLAYNTAYSLTAGGKTVVFKMPASDNTNTTYSFASGNGQFSYTPSGGSQTTVSIGKPSTAGTADKLGSSTIGSHIKGMWLDSGAPVAMSGTVGSATRPVYMSSGTITQTSGTLAVNINGNAGTASKLTNITTSDAASSSDTWRRVWFSYSDNTTGRPAYDDTFAYQSSTKTLKARKFYAEHQSGGGNEFRVTYGSTVDMALMIGSGDANHGLYDTKASKWMIYADTSGNVSVNGNATTATKLGTSNVGAADRPIYLSSGTATQTTYRMASTNASATGAVAISGNLATGIWYVNGTNSTDLYSIDDGAAYVNKYSDSWLHEIYGDYRTGQIAVRGKNNGTWQAWRKVLDSSNYSTWASPKAGSTDITTLGTITTGTWKGTAIASGYISTLPISKISGLGTAAQVASGTFSLSGHTHSYYPQWQTTSTTTDNTLYDYGVYVKQGGATVSPTGSAYFSILNIPYRKATGNTKADYAWSLGNSTGNDKRLFFRTSNADNYSSWQEVAHGEAGTAVGSATKPVYMTSSGVITACSGTLAVNISGNAATATTATKLGTANKGSATKGIYLSSGSPSEMSYSLFSTVNSGSSATNKLAYYSGNNAISVYTSTVGSHTKGMWLNAGVPTAMSGTVGSATKPAYLSSGTITVCSGTLAVNVTGNAATATTATKLGTANKGSTVKGIYLSSGSPAEMTYSLYATVNSGSSATNKLAYYSGNNAVSVYTSTVGSHIKGMWLNGGVPTVMSGTVGTAKRPVYLSSGTVTAVNWAGTSLPANNAGVNGDIFFLRL